MDLIWIKSKWSGGNAHSSSMSSTMNFTFGGTLGYIVLAVVDVCIYCLIICRGREREEDHQRRSGRGIVRGIYVRTNLVGWD